MEIKQSEDRCYMWRITEDENWQGGYRTFSAALDAMLAAYAKRQQTS